MNVARPLLSSAFVLAALAGCRDPTANTNANASVAADSLVGVADSPATSTQACNPTHAEILGEWARPEVHYINVEGAASPAPGWEAELWLPESSHADGCWFSCASKFRSSAFTAAGPATFVRLVHRTDGARPVRVGGAMLSVEGAAGVAQTAMRTERFDASEVTADQQSNIFAFPPTNPRTWDALEVTIPIERSQDQLRVRFTRGPSRPGFGANPPRGFP
ncbi:MAG: hypothetical protein ACRBN8_40245 [Nannocystales bacterium]